MKRHSMQPQPSLVPVLITLMLAIVAAAPTAAQQGGDPVFAEVTLELTLDTEPCASVTPLSVEIYTGDQKNPRAVEWKVVDTPLTYEWVMKTAEEGKGESTSDFGPMFRIPCGQDSAKSGYANQPGIWYYDVLVYECPENGQPPADAEPICVVDPDVIISEPPGDP